MADKIEIDGAQGTKEDWGDVLSILQDAPGNQMRLYLKDTPVAGMDYWAVSKDERKQFPHLVEEARLERLRVKAQAMPGAPKVHVPEVRPACIHKIERELGIGCPSCESGNVDIEDEDEDAEVEVDIEDEDADDADPDGKPGSRKNRYIQRRAEKRALKWAKAESQKWCDDLGQGLTRPYARIVGDDNPKPGYDVKIRFSNGWEWHIEAKGTTKGLEDLTVPLTEGERAHLQDGICPAEDVSHILFLVYGITAVKDGGRYDCSGGTAGYAWPWKIDEHVESTPGMVPTGYKYLIPELTLMGEEP